MTSGTACLVILCDFDRPRPRKSQTHCFANQNGVVRARSSSFMTLTRRRSERAPTAQYAKHGTRRGSKKCEARSGGELVLFQSCPICLCIESPPLSFATLNSESLVEATKAMRAIKTINKAALKSVDLNFMQQPGDFHVTGRHEG